MRVVEALEIAGRDNVGYCKSCSDLAIDGQEYCRSCKWYWDDVRNGFFDDWYNDD